MNEADILKTIESSLNGNRESFASIVRDFQKPLYHFCFHFLGNMQDAEDASVDIFLKAYRALGSFDSRYRFSSWFYKIAYNHLVEVTRRRKRENRYFGSIMGQRTELTEKQTPDSIFFKLEEREEVKNVLQSISLNHKTALMLRYYHQLSYREIGHIMKIPKNTVASLLMRGKRELRKKLDREEI